ncbi:MULTISPECIES: hypothetical protein [unclassified Rickettsia]
MTQPFFNIRTIVGLTGVVAWMVKNALGVILAKGGNPDFSLSC